MNLSPELFIKYENVSDENVIKCEKQSKYYQQNNTKIIQIIDKQSNRQGYLHISDENEGVLTKCVRQLKQLKDDQKIYKDNNDPRYSPSKWETYKLIVNSIYGMLGQIGGRLYVPEYPCAVTYHVWESLKSCEYYINNVMSINTNPIIFANTDSIFFKYNDLKSEYLIKQYDESMNSVIVKPNTNLIVDELNTFSNSLVNGLIFTLEGICEKLLVPKLKNCYISFKIYNVNNIINIPQFSEELFSSMLYNPNNFIDIINKIGEIEYKNFKYHAVPEFYQKYLDILTYCKLFYQEYISESHISWIYEYIQDKIYEFIQNKDLISLSKCVKAHKYINKT